MLKKGFTKNKLLQKGRILNMEIYANLHLHSTHSDGVYSPAEMVKVAKAEGYKALALADHDIGTGYPELKAACEEEGMECIFAVEFTVREPMDCHIVGFDFDPEYPPMKEYLADMGIRQTDNTKKCFEEAVENGGISGITWDEVLEFNKGIVWLCNNHVWRAMKAKGLVEESGYMAWFIQNFRDQRGKYPPVRDFKTLQEIVSLIKAAGGFAVIAHPHSRIDKIDFLMECGIEGIEVWHADHSPEERKKALAVALEKGLYISGGSDHSGLCGGFYDSYPSEEALRESHHYIEPLSAGTTEAYFRELQARRINR